MAKTVRVALGLTLNLGDYQSARIDVGIDQDLADDTPETLEATYEECRAWCADRVRKEKERILKKVGKD